MITKVPDYCEVKIKPCVVLSESYLHAIEIFSAICHFYALVLYDVAEL